MAVEPNQIVRALRENYDETDTVYFFARMLFKNAADCIEKLLEEIHNATVHADCMEAKASAYQAELEASKRRERAATECIGEIEYALDKAGYTNSRIDEAIFEWRGPEQEGESNHE